jgi:hypothetical protein
MLALPAHPGRVGIAFLALGLLLGLVVAVVVWLNVEPSLRRHRPCALAALAATLVLASAVAAAPFVAWRIVEDVRSTAALSRGEAEQVGGASAHVDPAAVAALGRRMAAHDTYAVVASEAVGDARTAFWEWAAYALLPRLQVSNPARATWILSWGRDPRDLGVALSSMRTLVTHGGPAPHVYYLARVRR